MPCVSWVIQKNLIREETLERLRKALQENGIRYEEVFVIPFSEELPPIQHQDAFPIFYGSTTLMLNAYHHPTYQKGIFYDPDQFQMATYLAKWNSHLLNSDGRVTTFRAFVNSHQSADATWFIRPNADTKSFSGMVRTFAEIKAWGELIAQTDNSELSLDSLLFVSSPKLIDKEWRNFIVNGKVISSSRYQEKGELSLSATDIPPAMVDFVEARCQEYTPHSTFVMDVAFANQQYAILECNCFNGTGFYANDISIIIQEVTKAVRAKH